MARKKAPPGSLLKRPLGPNFIAQWRDYKDMTQEDLVLNIINLTDRNLTAATLSRIENSKSPYSQWQIEAIAEIFECRPGDLLMRNPLDTDAPWAIWETLSSTQRKRAIRLLKAVAEEDEERAA